MPVDYCALLGLKITVITGVGGAADNNALYLQGKAA